MITFLLSPPPEVSALGADVVSRRIGAQSVFPIHPLVELRPGQGLQQPDHGGHDPALLDKIDLALEDGGRIAVEADDESPAPANENIRWVRLTSNRNVPRCLLLGDKL